MVAADAVAVVLLAAGRSTRFGPRDKLAEPLEGLPLGLHAASMLATLPFAARIAVTRTGGPDFGRFGFECVVNPDPVSGQAASIRLGVARARQAAPRAVLIALADMPFVTPDHIGRLLAAFDGAAVVASTDGVRPSPPALFGAGLFDTLEALSGDAGARGLLREAVLVRAAAGALADIDTPGDLRSTSGFQPVRFE